MAQSYSIQMICYRLAIWLVYVWTGLRQSNAAELQPMRSRTAGT
jgi:hypothetical protein